MIHLFSYTYTLNPKPRLAELAPALHTGYLAGQNTSSRSRPPFTTRTHVCAMPYVYIM